MSLSYRQAGVDIDAGNALVQRIKNSVKQTKRPGSDSEIGGFGALFDMAKLNYKDPILVSSTDGVGTKLKIAFALNKHDTIGIDLVAMSVNDILTSGAEPLFFLDYFACSKLSVETAASVIEGIANGCKQAGCALIGGETAEMPGMYTDGEYDLAGFAVGVAERSAILPKGVEKSDVIIGLKSSGLHSNGYSLARMVVEKSGLSFESELDIDSKKKTIGEILLEPTKIYVKPVLSSIKLGKIKAIAHITGGGITENVPRVIPSGLEPIFDYSSWKAPEIFNWMKKSGNIDEAEMRRTFNLGIGMVLVCAKSDAESVLADLAKNGETGFIIGKIS